MTGLVLHGTFGIICALAAATFLVLTGCLLSRYTVWIAAILGSATLAVTPAVALGLATESLPGGHWGGASVGALLGLAAGFRAYWRLTKKVSDPSAAPPRASWP